MKADRPAEVWTTELQRNGRLVLRPRWTVLFFVALATLFFISNAGRILPNIFDGEPWEVFTYVRAALALAAAIVALTLLNRLRHPGQFARWLEGERLSRR